MEAAPALHRPQTTECDNRLRLLSYSKRRSRLTPDAGS